MTETFKKIGISKSGLKTYEISNMGRCRTTNNLTGEQTTSWGNLNKHTGYLSFAGDYVHRHVARAFLKRPSNSAMTEVQHLDANKHNCAVSNLEWATPKQNNNNEITNQRRREGHVYTRHAGQIIKAEKDGVTLYFKSGPEIAQYLGVSHVLIYNAINKKQSARRARGWELSWVPMSEAR